ncbi:N-acetylmuramoyl-L-alanine amidase family protein [Desulfosporosinus metallidurans]|uniref:N-acetylmuramoyl-L-alanine amidase n=1 Tax=Desulfosporosinus metallidurans TaxID=1888891 RepID=A0A1Q8QYD6_9FIRM|nr:N-acetylmuramoyl-L-alanine amidase [Desulfosporosinus metallidurans]OLN32347.1 N-acetylmuramoyl-L-alanine amidase [Desulfosporosinus metallidurans]
MKVCLDPGHGGYDPGAEGNGLREKDITLDVCLKLKPLLEFNGVSTFLTRDGDYAPSHLEGDLNGELRARVDIAERNNVDLFVSVHVNDGGGTGEEILVTALGGRAETAANMVLPYLVQVGQWVNRGVKTQNVLVLKETSMPAILTENGFIDNATDAAQLKDPKFRQILAAAHAQGICNFFGIQYKDGGNNVLEVAVLLFTKEDFWSGSDVAVVNGNCGIFVRAADQSVPKEAMNAKTLIVIGGSTTNHPNEILLSGKSKYDTAAAVGKYLSGATQ